MIDAQDFQELRHRVATLERKDHEKEVRLAVIERLFANTEARHARSPSVIFGAISTGIAILMGILALYATGVTP